MRTCVTSLAVILALALAGCKTTPPKASSSNGGSTTSDAAPAATSNAPASTSSSAASAPAKPSYGCSVCGTTSTEPGNCPNCGGPMTEK